MNKIELLGTLEECFERNTGLIHKGCNKYKRYAARKGIEYDDLFQMGSIALVNAYNSYDINRDNGKGENIKFSSLALVSIYREILRYIIRFNNGMKASSKVREILSQIYLNGWQNLSDEEIAEKTGRTVKFIKSITSSKNLDTLYSLDKLEFEDGDDFYTITGYDPQICEVISFKEVFKILKDKERKVLELHLKGFSQNEISEILKVSQPHVSRIFNDAKRKIKKELEML